MKKQPLKKLRPKKTKPHTFKKTRPQKSEPLVNSNEKSESKETYFPSFYRSFPALHLRNPFSLKKTFLLTVSLYILYLVIIIAITSISMDIYKNMQIEHEVYAKKNTLYHKRDYWEKVVETHPGYRDAYYNLAVLELQLGNKEKAKKNLENVLRIDPMFQKGRELEKLLSSKY